MKGAASRSSWRGRPLEAGWMAFVLFMVLVSASSALGQTLDFGDYNAFGSASSTRVSTIKIGATTDTESSATTNATATGDDITGTDDEDGVTVPASIVQGTSGSLTVNVTNSSGSTVYLNVWIDFNRNGVLTDSGEQIATNTTISNGTSNSNRTVNFTVPVGASLGTAGVRVRLTSTSSPGSTGQSGNGEVEDNTITITSSSILSIGNLVWHDVNENGLKDGAEPGVPNVVVELLAPGADNAIGGTGANADTVLAITTTNASGEYSFTSLNPARYYVRITPPGNLPLASIASVTADNGVDNDSNGTQSGSAGGPVLSPVIQLTLGGEPGGSGSTNVDNTIDFGLIVGNSVIWLIDEDKTLSTALRLWSFANYRTPTTTATDYGRLKYRRPSDGAIRDIAECGDIEAMAVNRFTGEAYIFSSGRISGAPSNTQSLWTYNLNDAPANIGNIVLTLIGNIQMPTSGAFMEALAYDPDTKRFFTADPRDSSQNSSTTTDRLYYFDIRNLNANPMLATPMVFVGDVAGQGQVCRYADGLEFDAAGRLYIVDGTDNHLYEISPTTGAILNVADNDIGGGPGGSVDVETMAWDEVSNRMIAVDNSGRRFIEVTLGSNGANIGIASYRDNVPGMPSNADLEASAMYDTYPPLPRVGVGNAVFIDANNNGRMDSGEGVNGVTVELYEAGDHPLTDSATAITTTANGGLYFFGRLLPDNYFIHIPPSNFAYGQPLFGHYSVPGTAAGDDNLGEDGIDDPSPTNWGISSASFALEDNGEPTNATTETGTDKTSDDYDDDNNDLTIDFGFRAGPTIDFGDFASFASAGSIVIPTLKIGVSTDAETAATTNATATGDDITDSDDEDGVTVPASMLQGASGSLTVNVTNTSGATVFLNVWIDFNRNGLLTDAGEQVASNTVISNGTTNSNRTVNFTVPVGASPGIAGVRVRLTSTSNPGSTGQSGFGEVEDNVITITTPATLDFGDHASLATASSTANSNLRLGATVDTEYAATTNTSATGDDNTGIDDEDGVTVPASLEPGATITLPFSVTNTTGANAYLHAWIDFNNDGSMNNATLSNGGERLEVARVIPNLNTGTILREYWTGISGTAVANLTSNAAYPDNPTSYDYRNDFTAPVDWADNMGQRMRGWIYPPVSGEYTFWVSGDDETHLYLSSDETAASAVLIANVPGWTSSLQWTKYSQQKSVKITLEAGKPYYIEGIMKEGGGGDSLAAAWELPGTSTGPVVIAGQYLAPWNPSGSTFNGNQQITFTVPLTASPGANRAVRFRLTNSLSTLPTGASGTGEVEDYAVTITAPPVDFGDYNLFASASSQINAGLRIGALTDGEASATTDATATGDDLAGIDDEDGVTLSSAITQGASDSLTVNVTNTSGSSAYLNVWIDFNRNGSLTDSGEQVAVNTVITNGTTDSNRTINFTVPVGASLGTAGVRVRLTSTSSPGATGSSGSGEVEDNVVAIVAPTKDFGDYANFSSASSTADNRIKLGALVDTEGAATLNLTAMGDDTTGVDDEDGVVFPSMTAGQPVTLPVTVTNTSGAVAYLNAWIDFNNNGLLTDAGEQIATNIAIANGVSNATQNVSFTVPTDTITAATNLGARFRITSTPNPGPIGDSGLGEVEDHAVVILAPLTDFGDFSGAADVSNTASSNLRLGALVDTEYSSTRNADATGDDITGNDDEDGVTLPSMIAGAPAIIPVVVTNTTGSSGYLNVWIDYNNNGVFTDAGEQIAINRSVVNGTTNSTINLNITVPPTAVTGVDLGARFRITTDISPGAVGAGGIGEVEDYVINIAAPITDFGDFAAFGSASSTMTTALRMGALVDAEYNATTNAAATGDNITGLNDEDGVTLPAMIAGAPATIPVVVTNTTGASAYLNAWIDYNGNGSINDPGEQIATNVLVSTGVSNSTVNLNITVPATTLTGVNLGVRFRLSSTATPGSTGASGAGEVEDYIVNITAPTTDYGDFSGFADASQGVSPGLRMGASIDAEYASTRDATATGDDLTGIDDEDGVTLPSMTAGQTVTIPVTVTNTTGALGYLNVWIDFNNNGVLTDSGEQIATNINVITGTTDGVINLTVAVPANAVTGTNLGARFRLSAPTSPGPTGANAAVGEIEDYVVNIAAPTTDFGDFSRFSSASSTMSTALRLGALVDAEFNATTNLAATGDNITGLNDEDSVVLPSMTAGQTLTIAVAVTNTSGATGFLNAWIDYNNNGLLTDSGEQIAINRTIANGTNNSSVSLTFTVPTTAVTGTPIGLRLRLTSTSSPGSTGFSGTGEVEDYVVTLISPTNDFGDWSGAADASNGVSANLRLGALTDAEFSSTTNADATGDDITGVDDEDGVTLPSMIAGAPTTIPVTATNTSGATAYLNAWIDFNNNGSFTDSGEQVAINTAIATGTNNGTFNVSFTVPATAVTGVNLGARFRLTSTTNPGATGSGGGAGEVEDYVVNIAAPTTDFGDFSRFGSASSTASTNLRVGALVDTEFAATADLNANGDDITGVDDEDGVAVPAMTAGAPATIPVTVTNTTGAAAFLNVWIDFNNNGLLTDPGEQIATNLSIANGTNNVVQNLSITVPVNAVTETNLGVRVRLTSVSSPGATGAAGIGEVEDHIANIARPLLDYGDWNAVADAASTANNNLRMGALVDTEYTSTRNIGATGDDLTGVDDEDGVTLGSMTAGAPASISVNVTNLTGAGAFLNVWIDFNNNGSLNDPGEQITTNLAIANGTNNAVQTLNFTVPAAAATGASIGLRFRLTSVASPGITGIAGEGEVEDYVTTIAVPVTDFGDWSGAGDASSLASSDLRMGALADTEYVSTRNADASGDDITGSDDEDGVTFGSMTPGTSGSAAVVITNNSGAAGYLNAWIDFNNNNSFADAGEQIATNILINTGTNGATQTLNFAVPAGAIPGPRGARFRLTNTQNPTPLGASGTGEVEDHMATISCLPVTLSPSTLSNAAIGSSYSQTLSSTGGVAPYVYSVSSGSLPPGLNLNAGTGVLSGTPTSSGSFNFNLTTTDTYGCAATLTFALRVCPVITVNPSSLANSTAGSSYSQALTGGGGTGPYVFAVASGVLPAGLSLNTSTGVISGTPTSTATVVFTLRATDANGCTGTRNYVVTPACPQITVTPASLPSAQVNTPYSQTVAASGGSGPYTFAVSGGSLPAGLSLNTSSGVISGSITSATTASFTIRATASDGCVGSTSYSITPSCPSISLVPASLPAASLGYPYSETLTASGSAAPYTYTLQSGALPSGLVLASNGILNGAPSATGTFVFNIRVTDASGCTGIFPYTLLVGRLTLGNQIFEDSNNNGFKDAGEPGIAGAIVQLFTPGSDNAIGGSGAAADTQIGSDVLTSSTGLYAFTGLSNGNYYVKVTPPGSFFITSGTPATADNDIDNNNDGSQPGGPGTPSFSPIIALAAGTESITDGDTNSDTNLTIDFGFWSSVAVGNYVFLDVNGDGVLNPGERLQDVLIYLYTQGATPGTSAPASVALSDNKGRYYMDNLNPGNYFLHVPASQFAAGMPLAGLRPMATVVAGDDDAGQDLIFNNNPGVNGASTGVFALRPGLAPTGSAESGADGGTDDDEDARVDLTRDLGFVAPSGSGFAAGTSSKRNLAAEPAATTTSTAADTFALWRQTTAIGDADADPDADGLANLLEYALGTDPLSGVTANRFDLTQDGTGGIVARLILPLSTHDDIRLSLETLTDLTQATDPSAWQPLAMAAATTFNPDGTLTRRYAGLERLLVFASQNTGFLRLKVELDADRNGTPEATATSAIHAWSRQTFPTGTRSFSMPLLRPAVFTGRVTAATGNELTLPIAIILPAGSHYLEVLDGPLASQHFEIDAAISSGKTLRLSSDPPSSTGLAGARIAIRTHWMLADLLPPTSFAANDRVLFFNTAANDFTTFTLDQDTWTSGALSMNARPFTPPEAALVTVRDTDRILTFTGEVRAASFVIPLDAGTQLIGSGWPVTLPAPLVGLRSGSTPVTADRLRLWNGDTDPTASSYTNYYLDNSTSPPTWQPEESPDASFAPFRGLFLTREAPVLLNQTAPW